MTRSHSSTATCSSLRARWAPRQRCGPPANPRWGLPLRSMTYSPAPLVDARVAVRRGDQRVHHVPLAQRAAVELSVGRDLASVPEDDRMQPQRLLDGRRDQRRLVDQPPAICRIVGQVLEEVAELASRRVESGEHEHLEHVEDHGLLERRVVDGGVQKV